MNYRIGALGWFTHPSLRTGRPGDELNDSGNFGLLDIIHALKWVQKNIERFGGDRTNVTLSGESSGASNVALLLHSKLADSEASFTHVDDSGRILFAVANRYCPLHAVTVGLQSNINIILVE